MTHFDLLEQTMTEYNELENLSRSSSLSSLSSLLTTTAVDNCFHENIIDENGLTMCSDCGEEINRILSRDKEWRYYGQSDTRHNSDPNRVQQRKSEERTIFKDVENMDFSEKIIAEANKIYIQVTNGQIFRGNSRKAIIFASVFHAFKISGKPQSHELLINTFGLTRKIGLKGLKHIALYAPKSSEIRTTYITPVNLVEEIMDKFKATIEQKQEVILLYNKIKNKSSKLNRSRPQSTAAAIVYYWIIIKNKEISIKDFTSKINLSELTINKLVEEIKNIINGLE